MSRDFNGSDQHIKASSAVLSGVPITMACWFNTDSATALQNLIQISDISLDTTYFALEALGSVGGDPLRCITRAGANGNATTSTGYSVGTWHHACAVFGAVDSRAVYIDGGSKGTNITSITPSGLNATLLGVRESNGLDQRFNGEIAEAAIWDGALTDAEVASLAAGFSPLLIHPQNLVTYLPLTREILDIVGGVTFVNTGTIVSDHVDRIYNPAPPQIITAPALISSFAHRRTSRYMQHLLTR